MPELDNGNGHKRQHPLCPFSEREVKALIGIAGREMVLFPKWVVGVLVTVLLAFFTGAYAFATYNNMTVRGVEKSFAEFKLQEKTEEMAVIQELTLVQERMRVFSEQQKTMNDNIKELLQRQKGL